jgi:arylformamidase
MRIIDLTLPLYSGMPVYPGDPEVSIENIQTLEKEGWNMRRIEINGHDGTHVNAPIHMVAGGKTLAEMPLESFWGPAKIYDGTIEKGKGIIFRDQNIDAALAEKIKKARPLFVGLSSRYECDVEIEKDLLAHDIVLYERLANLDKVPKEFTFYGLPLNITGGDGSPVRAVAVVDNPAAFSLPEVEIEPPDKEEEGTNEGGQTHSWLQHISFTIGGITIGAAAVFGFMTVHAPICPMSESAAPMQSTTSLPALPPRSTPSPAATSTAQNGTSTSPADGAVH